MGELDRADRNIACSTCKQIFYWADLIEVIDGVWRTYMCYPCWTIRSPKEEYQQCKSLRNITEPTLETLTKI